MALIPLIIIIVFVVMIIIASIFAFAFIKNFKIMSIVRKINYICMLF